MQRTKIDHRSDIYSVGCVFYEMLVGLPPIVGKQVTDTILAHIQSSKSISRWNRSTCKCQRGNIQGFRKRTRCKTPINARFQKIYFQIVSLKFQHFKRKHNYASNNRNSFQTGTHPRRNRTIRSLRRKIKYGNYRQDLGRTAQRKIDIGHCHHAYQSGEGKTTMSIGLSQALCLLKKCCSSTS